MCLMEAEGAGSDTDAARNVILVQNWFEELKGRVPAP